MITYYLTKSQNTDRLYYSPVKFEETKLVDANGEERTVLSVQGDSRNLPTSAPRSVLLDLGSNKEDFRATIEYDPATGQFA